MDAVKRRTLIGRAPGTATVRLKRKRSTDGRLVREDVLALHKAGYSPRRIAEALALPLKSVEAVLSGKQRVKSPKKETVKATFKVERLVKARHRKEIAELEYRRELLLAQQGGDSQRVIAKKLQISQPSVKSALDTAAKVPMPLPGFSGASPSEICQRYAAGFISRDQVVDELTRFPYAKGDRTDGYDTLLVDPSGSWAEVSNAVRRGLIPDDVYEEVFNRRHAS